MTKSHEKLVRDKIPNLIMQSGQTVTLRQAQESERFSLLLEKLQEEYQEFLVKPSLEELVDLAEVVEALSVFWDKNLFSIAKNNKRNQRGGFEKLTILVATSNDSQ